MLNDQIKIKIKIIEGSKQQQQKREGQEKEIIMWIPSDSNHMTH